MVLSDAPGVVLLLFSFSCDLTSPSRTLPQGDDRNPAVIGQFISKNVFPFSHGQIHGIIAENSFSALRSALRCVLRRCQPALGLNDCWGSSRGLVPLAPNRLVQQIPGSLMVLMLGEGFYNLISFVVIVLREF